MATASEPSDDPDVVALVDHHCHGVVQDDLDREGFERLLTEGDGAGAFDTRTGLALRRVCAPVLGLPAYAAPEAYLRRRAELGHEEVTRRFLRAAGLAALCVDTGIGPPGLLPPAGLSRAAGPGTRAYEVVRLEALAEELLAAGEAGAGFPGAFRRALATRTAVADGSPAPLVRPVAVKTVAAYRAGLELPAAAPSEAQVVRAAHRAVTTARATGRAVRVADPVLHAFLVRCGVDLGLPVQFHIGLGDADVHLARADPLLLTDLLRALAPSGVPMVLLHGYPFHRRASCLAQAFAHVYTDVGLALNAVGDRAATVLAEALEVAPFGKLLYSSDAYGLPELFHLGAELFRSALASALPGDLPRADARRITGMIAGDNARRVYGLER